MFSQSASLHVLELVVCALFLQTAIAPNPSPSSNPRRRSVPQIFLNPDRSIRNCPQNTVSCPITPFAGSNHECVNTSSDLDNCGGCAATGKGQICGKQAGVRAASCNDGFCQAYSCRKGYALNEDAGSCDRID